MNLGSILITLAILAVIYGCYRLGAFKRNWAAITESFWDLHSKAEIKANNWYWHSLALPLGVLEAFLLRNSSQGYGQAWLWFAECLIAWILIWVFEISQGLYSKEVENANGTNARRKDVIFTTACAWFGISLFNLIYFYL